jgi:hypothetical protein
MIPPGIEREILSNIALCIDQEIDVSVVDLII